MASTSQTEAHRDEVEQAIVATAARLLAERAAREGDTETWVTSTQIAEELSYDHLAVVQVLTRRAESGDMTVPTETPGELVVVSVTGLRQGDHDAVSGDDGDPLR